MCQELRVESPELVGEVGRGVVAEERVATVAHQQLCGRGTFAAEGRQCECCGDGCLDGALAVSRSVVELAVDGCLLYCQKALGSPKPHASEQPGARSECVIQRSAGRAGASSEGTDRHRSWVLGEQLLGRVQEGVVGIYPRPSHTSTLSV